MLPFLKRSQEASAMGDEDTPTETRKHDDGYNMLDAIAEDFIAAFERKDKKMLKGALEALCEYVRSDDETQDEGMPA